MADKMPQNYSNHRRFVPLYHFVLSLLLVLNLGWTVWRLIRQFSAETVFGLLLAIALVIMFYYVRGFPLAVQDRLIRLEERLRLQEVLPEELRVHITDLTTDQLIGLRFASDEEVPKLVPEIFEGKLGGREEIKKKVESWRPDYSRC
jgi:hypothetical protein